MVLEYIDSEKEKLKWWRCSTAPLFLMEDYWKSGRRDREAEKVRSEGSFSNVVGEGEEKGGNLDEVDRGPIFEETVSSSENVLFIELGVRICIYF